MVQDLLSRLITIYWRQHSECRILRYFYYLSTQVSKVQHFFLLHQIATYWIQHGAESFITPNCYLLKTAWCTGSFITHNCYLLKTAWWKLFHYTYLLSTEDSMVQDLCYIFCRQHGTGSFITPNCYLLKTAQWMQDPLLLLLFIYLSQQGATFFLLHQIATYWIQHGAESFITPNCYLLKTAWCTGSFITPNCYLLKTAWWKLFHYTYLISTEDSMV